MSDTSNHELVQSSPARQLQPIIALATGSLALVVVGGIYMASYFPRRPPLGVPTALFAVSAALVALTTIMLTRLHDVAWGTFSLVARWALLAYVLQAGMIEYAFIRNHASGDPLVVVTLLLVLFAIDPPLIISTTVARYAAHPEEPAARSGTPSLGRSVTDG